MRWMILKNGTERLITRYSTSATSGPAIKKINDSRQSSITAITAAPITRNGARTTRRISIATASWSWLTSLVIRVISEGVPIWSISPWERLLI